MATAPHGQKQSKSWPKQEFESIRAKLDIIRWSTSFNQEDVAEKFKKKYYTDNGNSCSWFKMQNTGACARFVENTLKGVRDQKCMMPSAKELCMRKTEIVDAEFDAGKTWQQNRNKIGAVLYNRFGSNVGVTGSAATFRAFVRKRIKQLDKMENTSDDSSDESDDSEDATSSDAESSYSESGSLSDDSESSYSEVCLDVLKERLTFPYDAARGHRGPGNSHRTHGGGETFRTETADDVAHGTRTGRCAAIAHP